jgi:hypothetical protein
MTSNDTIINVELVNAVVVYLSYSPDIYPEDLRKMMVFLSKNNRFTGSKSNF